MSNQNKGHGQKPSTPRSGNANPGQHSDQMKQGGDKKPGQQGDPGKGARADAHRDPSGGSADHAGTNRGGGH